MEGERKQRPSDVGCRVSRIWGREQDVFLPRSHRALNVLRKNKQRPSDVGCRVPRIWGKEKDVFLPRSYGSLNATLSDVGCKYFEFEAHGIVNAWKENKQRRSEVP